MTLTQHRGHTVSKLVYNALRNRLPKVELKIEREGWVDVFDLVSACKTAGYPVNGREIMQVIKNPRRRFELLLSEASWLIRLHESVPNPIIEKKPPHFLFHGTAERLAGNLWFEGLKGMGRRHVHLTEDRQVAELVGQKFGQGLVFKVKARDMHDDGHMFWHTVTGVWLTQQVPQKYLLPAPKGL